MISSAADIYAVVKDPTDLLAWGSLVWSLAAVAIPGVPGSYVAKGGKFFAKSDDAFDLAQTADKLNNANQATKNMDKLQRGNKVHKDIEDAYVALGTGWQKEQPLGPAGRADLVNYLTKEIIEIKPNNDRAINEGMKQLDRYEDALQRLEPGNWVKQLLTYD